VLVFTAFRQTLDALAARLEREGVQAAVYHSSLSRRDKEAAVAAFRDQAPVLLSTESAGEGRNLQFCHVMANVDLPWNPMQIGVWADCIGAGTRRGADQSGCPGHHRTTDPARPRIQDQSV
jgi:superfamily II DNA/RNA helicase